MILVIDRRACTLRHDGGVIKIECDGAPPQRAPIAQLEQVVVYGNPMAETAVWRALATAGVPTVMLPSRGADGAAMLGSGLATQFRLRSLQHQVAANAKSVHGLAAWVVRQKLLGYDLPLRTLQQRHAAKAPQCAAFTERRDEALRSP